MPKSITVPLIEDGEDQILCLPQGFEFDSDQVMVTQVGKRLVLSREEFDVEAWLRKLHELADDDFMAEGRPRQGEFPERDWFD